MTECAMITIMNQQVISSEWPVLEPNDPPLDIAREEAAFEKVRERLVREHCGKLALIHGDDVVGVFDTADDAIVEGTRRFGGARIVVKEIIAPGPPDFISLVDVNHPSLQKID
jgi:hypothetical protein